MMQPRQPRKNLPRSLDYETPKDPSATAVVTSRFVLAGFFGIVAGLLGIVALVLGAGWGREALFYEDINSDKVSDWMKAIPLLAIGLVCTIAAIRWIRAALRD